MSAFPSDPEERMKLMMSLGEDVKKSLASGETKMWGMSVGGGKGFSISEGDPKDIFTRAARLMPLVKFKVKPMLTIDEVMDVMKEMQQ
jgi:hypothetical protein